MKKRLSYCLLLAVILTVVPTLSQARGTRYFVNWPTNHIGPVYVQIYDMQFTNPYEYVDNFNVCHLGLPDQALRRRHLRDIYLEILQIRALQRADDHYRQHIYFQDSVQPLSALDLMRRA